MKITKKLLKEMIEEEIHNLRMQEVEKGAPPPQLKPIDVYNDLKQAFRGDAYEDAALEGFIQSWGPAAIKSNLSVHVMIQKLIDRLTGMLNKLGGVKPEQAAAAMEKSETTVEDETGY